MLFFVQEGEVNLTVVSKIGKEVTIGTFSCSWETLRNPPPHGGCPARIVAEWIKLDSLNQDSSVTLWP